jgi:hypothetical protein
MGKRQCELDGCTKRIQVEARRTALLMAGAGAARRWTAPSPLYGRRHGALPRAWGRQAVPARGLLKGG